MKLLQILSHNSLLATLTPNKHFHIVPRFNIHDGTSVPCFSNDRGVREYFATSPRIFTSTVSSCGFHVVLASLFGRVSMLYCWVFSYRPREYRSTTVYLIYSYTSCVSF